MLTLDKIFVHLSKLLGSHIWSTFVFKAVAKFVMILVPVAISAFAVVRLLDVLCAIWYTATTAMKQEPCEGAAEFGDCYPYCRDCRLSSCKDGTIILAQAANWWHLIRWWKIAMKCRRRLMHNGRKLRSCTGVRMDVWKDHCIHTFQFSVWWMIILHTKTISYTMINKSINNLECFWDGVR